MGSHEFTSLSLQGPEQKPAADYGYVAASAGSYLVGDGADACYRTAVYMSHPAWPGVAKRDQATVRSLDELPGLVQHDVIPPEAAAAHAVSSAELAAGRLATAQMN